MLRYCLPQVKKRGYGLGNEFIPWARAFLASRLLRAQLLTPAFALNRRRYWRHFNTPLDDWIYNRAIVRLLPTVEFSEQDYVRHGGGDLPAALQSFAEENKLYNRAGYVFTTSGMWGGFRHIAPARNFIRSTLYQSRFAAGNLLKLHSRIEREKILVGMHVRLGDFHAPDRTADYGKSANTSLPIEWFCGIATALTEVFQDEVRFLVVSDGSLEQLRPLTGAYACLTTKDIPDSDCSDLLALADSDLLVCSTSSFSALAAFLSDSPYLWFAPNLSLHPEGCLSLGDFSAARGTERAATTAAVQRYSRTQRPWLPRGFGVGLDRRLSAELLQAVEQRRSRRQWQHDLISHGVIAAPPA